jgi:hypothetical protein
LFERCLNWHGLMVEANPISFAALKGSGRVHADRLNVAPACNFTDGERLRGSILTAKRVRIEKHHYTNAQTEAHHDESDHDKSMYNVVQCIPLTAILDALGYHHIDFFSLDVEGSEELVLSTLDLAAIPISVLLVEAWNNHCTKVCPKREAVRKRMAARGYELHAGMITKSDLFSSAPWAPQ